MRQKNWSRLLLKWQTFFFFVCFLFFLPKIKPNNRKVLQFKFFSLKGILQYNCWHSRKQFHLSFFRKQSKWQPTLRTKFIRVAPLPILLNVPTNPHFSTAYIASQEGLQKNEELTLLIFRNLKISMMMSFPTFPTDKGWYFEVCSSFTHVIRTVIVWREEGVDLD